MSWPEFYVVCRTVHIFDCSMVCVSVCFTFNSCHKNYTNQAVTEIDLKILNDFLSVIICVIKIPCVRFDYLAYFRSIVRVPLHNVHVHTCM